MRYNTKKKGTKTINRAGGDAYKMSSKAEIATMLLTSFVKEQYYRSDKEQTKELIGLLESSDKLFCAKAAIYARNVYGMRTITHIVAAEIARLVKGESWTKRFFEKVVRRPDDMTETLSYFMSHYGKTVPNSLKKGFGNAFLSFDEYQLSKYNGKNKEMSLIDAMRLVHPRAKTQDSKNLMKKLVYGQLQTARTWETGLTQAGQTAISEEDKMKKKKRVWEELIKERKIGYFALLRNLRNIIEQAPELQNDVCALLADERLIRKSLVLPFRFKTAFDVLQSINGSREYLNALTKALDLSLKNVPTFDGKTLIAVDCSGSMSGQPIEIASVFAAALYKSNDADLMLFSEDAEYFTVPTSDSTLSIANFIEKKAVYGGTNFSSIFYRADKAYDRIVILSDMQSWMDGNKNNNEWSSYCLRDGYINGKTLKEYNEKFGIKTKLFSFDLQGYGTLQVPQNDTYLLAGFSEKVFDIMKILEKDKNALVEEIEKITI